MTLNETIIKLRNTRDYENLNEILGKELGSLLYQVVDKSKSEEDMKVYATEAIKADRELIKAKKETSEEDGLESVSVYIIDNLPIELP